MEVDGLARSRDDHGDDLVTPVDMRAGHDRSLADTGLTAQQRFDPLGPHLLPARDDDIASPTGNTERTVVGEGAEITRGEPAAIVLRIRFTVGQSIAAQEHRPPQPDLFFVVDSDLDTLDPATVVDHPRTGLGHAIGGDHVVWPIGRGSGSADENAAEEFVRDIGEGTGDERDERGPASGCRDHRRGVEAAVYLHRSVGEKGTGDDRQSTDMRQWEACHPSVDRRIDVERSTGRRGRCHDRLMGEDHTLRLPGGAARGHHEGIARVGLPSTVESTLFAVALDDRRWLHRGQHPTPLGGREPEVEWEGGVSVGPHPLERGHEFGPAGQCESNNVCHLAEPTRATVWPVTQPVMWMNGQLVPSAEATVHVFSHGMQRGSTVFDVLKVVHLDNGPHAFGLREHVARFARSMQLMGMETEYEIGPLEKAVAEAVAANPGAEIVKLAAAWVEVPLRSLPVSVEPTVYVAAFPPSGTVDPGGSKETVKVKTATAPKMPADVLPPSLKVAASYTAGVRERLAAVAAGFDDVIFRSSNGDLAEGTTQSLFVINAGRVLLPPLDSVLDGITRRAVLDLAQHLGHRIEIRPVYWDEVTGADELFLSSTNAQVLPIEQLDEISYPAPGPISAELDDAVTALLSGDHPLSKRWLTLLQ